MTHIRLAVVLALVCGPSLLRAETKSENFDADPDWDSFQNRIAPRAGKTVKQDFGYRATNIALNYYGDSVINSVMDIGAMIAGFWLARIWPVWLTIAAALLMEAFVGYWIRDNLALNVIMLIHPVEAIRAWQSAT